ncbi:MAG: ABC transporter ATP-binding protein [Eubacteriales bacterium]
MISLKNITKEFKNGKGIFNLNLRVSEGAVYGYLGPNGAGKTTTIRVLMGFIRANSGQAFIKGLNCWNQAADIHKQVGYLAGEIFFLESIKGTEILELAMQLNKYCRERMKSLLERFQLDPDLPTRKMSKGMKQKLGVILAFMHDPAVYILDEPTSGLDPLMQRTFIDLILEEKGRGKTIFISSHIFQEVERTADVVGIIKDGRIVALEQVADLTKMQKKVYDITLERKDDATILTAGGLRILKQDGNHVEVEIQGNPNKLIQTLNNVSVVSLDTHQQDLEEIFMHYYEKR